jgi:hypothetical protein
MKRSPVRLALLSAAIVAATTVPLYAQTDTTPAVYAITSTIEQPGGPLVSVEVLTVTGSDGPATVTLSQPRTGQTSTLTANIDEHGVIGVSTTDPALTCYNTVRGLLGSAGDATASSAVEVGFAGNAVAVPLQVNSEAQADGTNGITMGGLVEGTLNAQPGNDIAIVVDGNAITRQQLLLGARLRETSVLLATHAKLAQSTCTISRMITQAPTQPA